MLADLALISPILICAAAGLVVLMAGVFSDRARWSGWLGYVSVAGMAAALGAIWWLWEQSPVELSGSQLAGSLIVDPFALAVSAIILVGAMLTTLSAVHYLPEQKSDHPEYYALLLFSVSGMLGMVMSRDLLSLFVCLEVMSMAVYILAGFKRQSSFSTESAMKYFITGSFASALLLLGIAYIWGTTGQLDMVGIATYFETHPSAAADPLSQLGMVLMLGAFAFKVAAAPFHMWTPDVYEGAPSTVSGFMAIAVKTAAFGALARLLITAFGDEAFRSGPFGWNFLVAVMAVASIIAGNLAALAQTNLKRVLAYSAIAHTGYLLIALVAVPTDGGYAVSTTGQLLAGGGLVFYLGAYTLANAGAFAVAAAISADNREDVDELSYAGLAKRSPLWGMTLTVSVISLLGIPTTAGFVGKLTVFGEALAPQAADGGGPVWLWLVIVAVLGSVISAWYYLRILVVAWMKDEVRPIKLISSRTLAVSGALAAVLTVFWGILPAKTIDASNKAGVSLVTPAKAEVIEPGGDRTAGAAVKPAVQP